MISLYGEYLKERTDDLIIEGESGFATYRYINDGKSVYIVDIFVTPTMRSFGLAAGMADAIAKEAKSKGCIEMLGTVVPSTKGSTSSVRVLLAYGMVLLSSSNDLIIFRKEL